MFTPRYFTPRFTPLDAAAMPRCRQPEMITLMLLPYAAIDTPPFADACMPPLLTSLMLPPDAAFDATMLPLFLTYWRHACRCHAALIATYAAAALMSASDWDAQSRFSPYVAIAT